MTRYLDQKRIAQSNNDISIIGEEQLREIDNRDHPRTYSCDYCHRTLSRLIDSSGNNADICYYCNYCKTTKYDIEELRSESYLETSEGPVTDPYVSYAPEPTIKRKKKEPKGGFKALQDKGIKITSYTEGKG
jgi:hypothetical protein